MRRCASWPRPRAASEQVLDRFTQRDADALAADGPYRAQPSSAVTSSDLDAAAKEVMNERDRAFDEALAAARGPARTAWDNSPDNPAVKAEIARSKAEGRKAWALDLTPTGWALVLVTGAAFLGFVGHKLYTDEIAARKAMAELGAITDRLCACETQRCAAAIIDSFDEREIDRLERTARDGTITTDSDVEDLGRRAERCIQELTFAPK